jgi:hypothetical protein
MDLVATCPSLFHVCTLSSPNSHPWSPSGQGHWGRSLGPLRRGFWILECAWERALDMYSLQVWGTILNYQCRRVLYHLLGHFTSGTLSFRNPVGQESSIHWFSSHETIPGPLQQAYLDQGCFKDVLGLITCNCHKSVSLGGPEVQDSETG